MLQVDNAEAAAGRLTWPWCKTSSSSDSHQSSSALFALPGDMYKMNAQAQCMRP